MPIEKPTGGVADPIAMTVEEIAPSEDRKQLIHTVTPEKIRFGVTRIEAVARQKAAQAEYDRWTAEIAQMDAEGIE